MPPNVSIEAARSYLQQLNLDYIVKAMCAPHYPLPRWTHADAQHCCQLYKNFVLLQKIALPELLVPSKAIDEFWHNHILYTRNYFRDCIAIFGHYMHHEPASPEEDAEMLIEGFKRTKQMYLEEFGEELMAVGR